MAEYGVDVFAYAFATSATNFAAVQRMWEVWKNHIGSDVRCVIDDNGMGTITVNTLTSDSIFYLRLTL